MKIDLNFLPFDVDEFVINVYWRIYKNEPRNVGFFVQKLPVVIEPDGITKKYVKCLISLSPFEGSEEMEFNSKSNHVLMTAIIWQKFKEKLTKEYSDEYEIIDGYNRFVSFVAERFEEGNRVIKVSPYYLFAKEKHGFILEFDFRKKSGVKFDRKIQELSFSLDSSGKSNINSYLDKHSFIQKFKLAIVPDVSASKKTIKTS